MALISHFCNTHSFDQYAMYKAEEPDYLQRGIIYCALHINSSYQAILQKSNQQRIPSYLSYQGLSIIEVTGCRWCLPTLTYSVPLTVCHKLAFKSPRLQLRYENKIWVKIDKYSGFIKIQLYTLYNNRIKKVVTPLGPKNYRPRSRQESLSISSTFIINDRIDRYQLPEWWKAASDTLWSMPRSIVPGR